MKREKCIGIGERGQTLWSLMMLATRPGRTSRKHAESQKLLLVRLYCN